MSNPHGFQMFNSQRYKVNGDDIVNPIVFVDSSSYDPFHITKIQY